MRRRFLQTYNNSDENLTIVSLEDNNEICLTLSSAGIIGEIEMKVSGDSKWVPNDTVILNTGDFIEYRGTISNAHGGYDRIGTFTISKKVNLYGDCTSILKDRMLFNYSLAHLFENTPVVNVHSNFLPATTLADYCYTSMFDGCTSLTTAPELPATTLADNCYDTMFRDCTSLTTTPVLPATTLAINCYNAMFYRCTSLTTAPELPATTLTKNCYQYMFYGCTKLNYIKMLATDISALYCLVNWVSGVANTGTFVKNPAMNSLPTGISGIPSGWTVVNDGEESESSLTFPVTLYGTKLGTANDDLGIRVYNFIKDTKSYGDYLTESEVIVINATDGSRSETLYVRMVYFHEDDDPILLVTDNSSWMCELKNDGVLRTDYD